MDKLCSEAIYSAILAGAVGSFLIIVNEWFKVFLKRCKQNKKLKIWKAMEQTGISLSEWTLEDLTKETLISSGRLQSLIYEMIQEGTAMEGTRRNTFTRHKPESIDV